MKKECANVTSIGQRVKQAARERNYTAQDIADYLHYSSEKTISRYYNDKQTFNAEQIKALSELFGLREDYLLCKDNFKTEEERLSSFRTLDLMDMKATLHYFSYLGYDFTPYYFWICSEYDYVKDFKILEKYFFDLDLEKKHYKILSSKKRLSTNINLRIKLKGKMLSLDDLEIIDDITKHDTPHWKDSFILDDGEIIILYEIINNGKFINYVPMHKMKCFLNHVDNICKISAEYLLSSETFSHIDYDLDI